MTTKAVKLDAIRYLADSYQDIETRAAAETSPDVFLFVCFRFIATKLAPIWAESILNSYLLRETYGHFVMVVYRRLFERTEPIGGFRDGFALIESSPLAGEMYNRWKREKEEAANESSNENA